MSGRSQSALAQYSPEPDGLGLGPFDRALADDLRGLLARLDTAQRLWLSGYLAGIANQPIALPQPPAAADPARPLVTVLYGSQTGNAERLAKQLAGTLEQRGFICVLLDMMDCQKAQLQQAQVLLVVVSTHGEGDPPDRAMLLHELLHGRKAPKLDHVKFSVLALGDSSYEKFCQTGKDFDARLEALGGERLHPRVDCDVDFEQTASAWIESVVARLDTLTDRSASRVAPVPRPAASVSNAYTRKQPFLAPVLTNLRLTGRTSTRDVRHIELSLEGSGIRYEPGDAIGVVVRNAPGEVDALLAALPFAPEAPVTADGETLPLRQALTERLDVGLLTRPLLERYAAAVGAPALAALLEPENQARLREYLHGRHLLDLVLEHPPKALDAAAFAALLRPLQPRLYSVASSQRATPDEAHLTVGLVQYESLGRARRGVASAFLAAQTGDSAAVPIYLHRNTNFRLPTDTDLPVIMIGPGTGVAPFRGFVAEREAQGARGRSWLFFGERNFFSDFLYQAEWLEWRKRGVLTRIDVAFSRDQDEKVYVQHRLAARGAELWRWLEDGAHVYVCGDAERMAPDVHRALLDIVREHGGRTKEGAVEYVQQLQRERRYQRDVW